MLSIHSNTYTAADIECPCHLAPVRVYGFHKIIENNICDMFMKVALVAKRPEIELERFRFHDFLVGDILYANGGKIGLTGDGADAGELAGIKCNEIISSP